MGALGEPVGELNRHLATEAVPDDRRPLQARGDQKIPHYGGVGVERVEAPPRRRGQTVAGQIRGDHVGVHTEQRRHRGPGLRAPVLAVQQHHDRAAGGDTRFQERHLPAAQTDHALHDNRGLRQPPVTRRRGG